MKQQYYYYLISIFAIFIGSQITEGAILVPYWQSLSAQEFYRFYSQFGPQIGRFYTILTIIAVLIPIYISVSFYLKKSPAFKYALAAVVFALLFLASFYVYFKGANELFYQGSLSEENLKMELRTWSIWHWSRVGLEFLSLIFLILAMSANQNFQAKNAS